ncbi:hypothetical protein IE81DRAFT_126183 [Ceraceosorus guamensis]|uniref:Uncharacterized protein n=1 Tax=Ceraceosorus guamensis TaxID=1522189 RepID=A0A316W890_9BASI|nr:hypothetical protein IE81DRAFT_126183 [Ceraceosorus guamensis]PWN45774.1 hypothetical protein IE81DRAFT_126183 [Ceraceosorus guamensis]
MAMELYDDATQVDRERDGERRHLDAQRSVEGSTEGGSSSNGPNDGVATVRSRNSRRLSVSFAQEAPSIMGDSSSGSVGSSGSPSITLPSPNHSQAPQGAPRFVSALPTSPPVSQIMSPSSSFRESGASRKKSSAASLIANSAMGALSGRPASYIEYDPWNNLHVVSPGIEVDNPLSNRSDGKKVARSGSLRPSSPVTSKAFPGAKRTPSANNAAIVGKARSGSITDGPTAVLSPSPLLERSRTVSAATSSSSRPRPASLISDSDVGIQREIDYGSKSSRRKQAKGQRREASDASSASGAGEGRGLDEEEELKLPDRPTAPLDVAPQLENLDDAQRRSFLEEYGLALEAAKKAQKEGKGVGLLRKAFRSRPISQRSGSSDGHRPASDVEMVQGDAGSASSNERGISYDDPTHRQALGASDASQVAGSGHQSAGLAAPWPIQQPDSESRHYSDIAPMPVRYSEESTDSSLSHRQTSLDYTSGEGSSSRDGNSIFSDNTSELHSVQMTGSKHSDGSFAKGEHRAVATESKAALLSPASPDSPKSGVITPLASLSSVVQQSPSRREALLQARGATPATIASQYDDDAEVDGDSWASESSGVPSLRDFELHIEPQRSDNDFEGHVNFQGNAAHHRDGDAESLLDPVFDSHKHTIISPQQVSLLDQSREPLRGARSVGDARGVVALEDDASDWASIASNDDDSRRDDDDDDDDEDDAHTIDHHALDRHLGLLTQMSDRPPRASREDQDDDDDARSVDTIDDSARTPRRTPTLSRTPTITAEPSDQVSAPANKTKNGNAKQRGRRSTGALLGRKRSAEPVSDFVSSESDVEDLEDEVAPAGDGLGDESRQVPPTALQVNVNTSDDDVPSISPASSDDLDVDYFLSKFGKDIIEVRADGLPELSSDLMHLPTLEEWRDSSTGQIDYAGLAIAYITALCSFLSPPRMLSIRAPRSASVVKRAQEHSTVASADSLKAECERLYTTALPVYQSTFNTLRSLWRWDSYIRSGTCAAAYIVCWQQGVLLIASLATLTLLTLRLRGLSPPHASTSVETRRQTKLVQITEAGAEAGSLDHAIASNAQDLKKVVNGLSDLHERLVNFAYWRSPAATFRTLLFLALCTLLPSLLLSPSILSRLPGLLLGLAFFALGPIIEQKPEWVDPAWYNPFAFLLAGVPTRAQHACQLLRIRASTRECWSSAERSALAMDAAGQATDEKLHQLQVQVQELRLIKQQLDDRSQTAATYFRATHEGIMGRLRITSTRLSFVYLQSASGRPLSESESNSKAATPITMQDVDSAQARTSFDVRLESLACLSKIANPNAADEGSLRISLRNRKHRAAHVSGVGHASSRRSFQLPSRSSACPLAQLVGAPPSQSSAPRLAHPHSFHIL